MAPNDQDPNRRDFLRATAVAASTFAVAAQPAGAAGWFERPMRWAQLTLVENDPGKYDLHFWLDYFKRTHSDAACLSAGGCVAYYPTKSRCTTAASGSAAPIRSATSWPAAAN